jgi:diguanylate cyclase (GGDEF)-like protein
MQLDLNRHFEGRSSQSSEPSPYALIADGDESVHHDLRPLLEREGLDCQSVRTWGAGSLRCTRRLPTVLIAGAQLADGSGYSLVNELRRLDGGHRAAALILRAVGSSDDLAAAVRCGADGSFSKPVDWGLLMRRLHYLLQPRAEAGRILALERDAGDAAALREILDGSGHQLWICDDPQRFVDDLGMIRPDLVLISAPASGEGTYDLLRWLRQQEKYATLPALFIAEHGELHARIETARAGGDDHLVKPVPHDLLLSAVEGRLERSRYLNDLINQDDLTRLLHGTALMERAREHVELKRQDAEHRAVWVIIDLDHFKAINDQHGHGAGDGVLVALADLLRRSLRQSDSIGRCGGEEFAILIDRSSEDTARRVVDRLRQDFSAIVHPAVVGSTSSFQTTLSAGLAALRPGMSVVDWREAADAALYQAKALGRNRVEPATCGLGLVSSSSHPRRRNGKSLPAGRELR